MRYYLNPKVNHSQLGYEGMGGGGMLVKQRALTGAQSAALALSQVGLQFLYWANQGVKQRRRAGSSRIVAGRCDYVS